MKNNKIDKNTKELLEVIISLEKLSEAEAFFRDLCTIEEIRAMSERWQIVKMLAKDYSYRQIAEELGVSTTTVSRVAFWYRNGTGAYASVLKSLSAHHNSTKVFRKS